ncbi:hypothetical protein [Phytohabitans houttuyneae]|uniref:Uncharacterized protein n=1 Tax=Phytohabitans houttuyneae TaxID=1076126 RepID=A0A6V8K5M5_9ACTN|nr:hypothetical protein [Phytohabitans houttuyneae]GFJ79064.1 hypothetical protein Phou_032440 [Phytohabitans houttuyneae]
MTDQLDDFFADYRAGLTPEIAPAGPGAVRATVRRRRRIAATALVATAVVLVAAPVAGYAALNRGTDPAPAPAGSNTPTPEESTSTPTPSPPASTTPPPPDGRISKADLLRARVTLPDWAPDAPCAEEGARLTSVGDENGDILLTSVKYGDVDRDGAEETIALVDCVYAQTGQAQVVVFDRDAGRKIVTLGRVVATDRIVGYPTLDQVGWIKSFEPLADGGVRVTVGDVRPCCGWEEEWSQKQARTYTWQDGRFRQTGGPVRFEPNPLFTDLVVSVPDLKLMINNDGNPYGTVSVTVRNKGDLEADVSVNLELGTIEAYRIGPGWAACSSIAGVSDGPSASYQCDVDEPLAPGEERVLRFGIQAAATGPVTATGSVTVSDRPNGEYLPDQTGEDNSTQFKIS